MSKRCEKCGQLGGSDHHLLLRSTYPEHKREALNLICLCDGCHLYDFECGPHGDGKAVMAFNGWVKRNHPEKWAFMVEHSRRALATDEMGDVAEELLTSASLGVE